MFGLSSRNNSVRYGALFDVGSESVGVAIVMSKAGDVYPTILFSHRTHMRISGGSTNHQDHMRHMKEALFSASLILSRDGFEALRLHNPHATVREILLTVSAPWARTVSKNVVYKGDTELKVTRSLIDELLASAEEEIQNQIEQADSVGMNGFVTVEKTTVDVRVNDYMVQNPLGLKGKEISLVQVTGFMLGDIVYAVEEVRDKVFPNTHIRSHTFLLTLYCVIRELIENHTKMTLVHITGETSEFGIVENDRLIESISIPYGFNSIVRDLIGTSGKTTQEVHSLLTLYEKDHLSPADSKQIHEVLTQYTQNVVNELRPHAEVRSFPPTTFVLAPTSYTPLFKKILEPILTEVLGTNNEVLTLPNENLGSTPTHDVNDDHIAVLGHFFHKLHSCGEIERRDSIY